MKIRLLQTMDFSGLARAMPRTDYLPAPTDVLGQGLPRLFPVTAF